MSADNEQLAVFELGKHMQKLSVDDSADAIVFIRPRYEKSAEHMARVIKQIDHWKKSNGVSMRILLVPHDFDLLAVETKSKEEQ